jgi:hypothetical protein
VPEGFSATLKDAARRQFTTRSEYVRRSIMRQLADDGVCLVPNLKPAA